MSKSFIDSAYQEYSDWLEKNDKLLKKIFCLANLIDHKAILELQKISEEKRDLILIKTMGKIPEAIFKDLSPKQKGNITKWSKNVFRGDYLIGRGLRDLEKVDIMIELENIKKLNIDQDILLKLTNAKKLHHLAFFDSSIVTCGKITELVLKRKMEEEKINFDNKSGLSRLFNTLKNRVTLPKHGDKIIENIQEIIRIIRNTYAHDNLKLATKEESELV